MFRLGELFLMMFIFTLKMETYLCCVIDKWNITCHDKPHFLLEYHQMGTFNIRCNTGVLQMEMLILKKDL